MGSRPMFVHKFSCMLNGNGHTNAYNLLKSKIQEVFDFASATTQAFPIMRDAITNNQPLPPADYFRGNNSISLLQNQIATYEQNLSTYLFLVSFSYFENYLKNAVIEIIDEYNDCSLTKAQVKSRVDNPIIEAKKLKLRGNNNSKNALQYQKYSQELRNNNYLEADNLFKFTSKNILKSTIKDLKAYQIPDFLKGTLLVQLPPGFASKFKEFSEVRNKIAHGTNPAMSFSDVNSINDFFRKSASKIDLQLTSNFFFPSNYLK